MRHLIAVIEHANIVRAAKAIHISQPALTKSIQNLESELDVKLLERTPRGATPTIYGNVLFKHARLLLNENEQAIDVARRAVCHDSSARRRAARDRQLSSHGHRHR